MNIEKELSMTRDATAVVTAEAASGPESAAPEPTEAAAGAATADVAMDDDLPLSDSGPETALCW